MRICGSARAYVPKLWHHATTTRNVFTVQQEDKESRGKSLKWKCVVECVVLLYEDSKDTVKSVSAVKLHTQVWNQTKCLFYTVNKKIKLQCTSWNQITRLCWESFYQRLQGFWFLLLNLQSLWSHLKLISLISAIWKTKSVCFTAKAELLYS